MQYYVLRGVFLVKSRANRIALIALAAAVAVCICAVCLNKAGSGGKTASIWVDGEVVRTVPLSRDCTFSITNSEGHTVEFEVKDGKIRFVSSDCPDKICVNTGFISLETETAICMPNRISVTIGE